MLDCKIRQFSQETPVDHLRRRRPPPPYPRQNTLASSCSTKSLGGSEDVVGTRKMPRMQIRARPIQAHLAQIGPTYTTATATTGCCRHPPRPSRLHMQHRRQEQPGQAAPLLTEARPREAAAAAEPPGLFSAMPVAAGGERGEGVEGAASGALARCGAAA
jgi:hypothetical protein